MFAINSSKFFVCLFGLTVYLTPSLPMVSMDVLRKRMSAKDVYVIGFFFSRGTDRLKSCAICE